ncbi:NAD(P)-binding domain-containing protein [Longispora sp. NPDC051575]|uniref:flavin-containing monooxygenase n=1 Tax=Longispora sp. NPDC051575 TaxID=3154943 RepID=UPI00343F118B
MANDGPWGQTVAVDDRGAAVCVIGAGSSGLAAVKNLLEHGFAVDCYDRETGIGGAWNIRHERSPVYSSTHLISSKPMTQFPDFPLPDHWPDYPHHSQLLAYFERYAEHFGLREHIWFGTEVVSADPIENDRWRVRVRPAHGGTERELSYAAVVVANGHNSQPRTPALPGIEDFRGTVIHAGSYKDAAVLRGKKVLVVGGGNTGCDIAVEAAQQAAACWHSTRRGYWYAPKYVFGRPADQVNDGAQWLPLRLRQWAFHRVLRLTVGDLTRFGLRKPDHKVYETHPIVNSQLVYYVGHGAITPVHDVKRFNARTVEFEDGTEAEPDLVVLATGYAPRFEFLDPGILGANPPRLWLHMFAPRHPTLAVAGLVQPDSGQFPLVHWQTQAIARWLTLRNTNPERAAQIWAGAADRAEWRWTKAKVSATERHWFEVSHVTYLKAVESLLKELTA